MGCRDQTWGKQNDLWWKKLQLVLHLPKHHQKTRLNLMCHFHPPSCKSVVCCWIHLSRQTPRECEQPGVNTTRQVSYHFWVSSFENKSSFSPLDSFHPAHLGIKKVFFHLLDPTWMAGDMRMKRFLPKRTCFGAFSRSTCIYVYKGFRANKLSGHPHSSGADPSWVFTPFESNLQIVLTTNDSSNVILGNSDL